MQIARSGAAAVRQDGKPTTAGRHSFIRVHKAAVAFPSLAHGRGLARWTMKTWISHVRLLHFRRMLLLMML